MKKSPHQVELPEIITYAVTYPTGVTRVRKAPAAIFAQRKQEAPNLKYEILARENR